MSEIQDKNENPDQFISEADEIAAIKAEQAQVENEAATEDSSTESSAAQIEALTANLQRERAEFSNFRRRVQTEKLQIAAQTSARLLTDLLPALDALDQFFTVYSPKAADDAAVKGIVDGLQLVQKQITRVFEESGVEEFSPDGQAFDPNFMEALSVQETDVENETVIQVFQKGYRIEGRVIRPARVVVAKPKSGSNK